jgi:hypothetical protein
VLRSKTPYAEAVQEDRLVDAKWDMQVGDATVSSWEQVMREATGFELGGIGEGGGGRGEGIGLGSVRSGGYGAGKAAMRGSFGITTTGASQIAPTRVDKNGHLRLEVPLGDIETTWRVVLVGLADGASAAVTSVDVSSELPLSIKVDTGARWTEGDEVDVTLTLRNRTDKTVRADLKTSAGGVAALADGRARPVDIPAHGTIDTTTRVRAREPGTASLDVTLQAPSFAPDVVHHTWDVAPAGERIDIASTKWIEHDSVLTPPPLAAGLRPVGAPRLVIQRGFEAALSSALDALDPTRQTSPAAVADALEVAARIARWAVARGGEGDPLAVRAATAAARAKGRLAVYAERENSAQSLWITFGRAAAWAPGPSILPERPPACPAETLALDVRLDALDAEPPIVGESAAPCWDSFVASTLQLLGGNDDPVALARAVLALSDRPQRLMDLAPLAARLWALYQMRSTLGADRAARATIGAALIRTSLITAQGATAPIVPLLLRSMLVQRDARGSFGSPLATRSVVRALLAMAPPSEAAARITVDATEHPIASFDLAPGATNTLSLATEAESVRIRATSSGLLALWVRPVLRPWSSPPEHVASPVHLETTWPERARARRTGLLRVALRTDLSREASIDTRIPLPPGTSLADPVDGVRQVQGSLFVRTRVATGAAPTSIALPLRFALSGTMTVPEASARLSDEEAPHAIAPARPLVVAGSAAR